MVIRSSLQLPRVTRYTIRNRLTAWQGGVPSVRSAAFASFPKSIHLTIRSPESMAESHGKAIDSSQDFVASAIENSDKPFEDSMKAIQADKIQFSEGEDHDAILQNLRILVERGWTVDDAGIGIDKTFKFKAWMKCIGFTARIGLESKAFNHHPVIVLRYGNVWVKWTTHRPYGLSSKDIRMAMYCDEMAEATNASNASIEFKE